MGLIDFRLNCWAFFIEIHKRLVITTGVQRLVMALKRLKRNSVYLGRHLLGRNAHTLSLLALLKFKEGVVRKDTELVVEGFPRSANSFMASYFSYHNSEVSKLAHHIHVTGQLTRAEYYKIPVILCIREPLETILSLKIIDEDLSTAAALWSYIDYYEKALVKAENFVVSDFEVTTKMPDAVLKEINSRFFRDYKYQKLDAETRSKIFDSLQSNSSRLNQPANLVPIPRFDKKRSKDAIRDKLSSHPLLEQAILCYQKISLHSIG